MKKTKKVERIPTQPYKKPLRFSLRSRKETARGMKKTKKVERIPKKTKEVERIPKKTLEETLPIRNVVRYLFDNRLDLTLNYNSLHSNAGVYLYSSPYLSFISKNFGEIWGVPKYCLGVVNEISIHYLYSPTTSRINLFCEDISDLCLDSRMLLYLSGYLHFLKLFDKNIEKEAIESYYISSLMSISTPDSMSKLFHKRLELS